jgi:hypothetical protein
MFPFGLGYFSAIFTLPPSQFEPQSDPFQFSVRRAEEGPQVVCQWQNPNGLRAKVVRRLKDYARTVPEGSTRYFDTGLYFSDVYVRDGVWYYYTLFVEAEADSGEYLPFGYGDVLAIDNQPYVDWRRLPPVISRMVTSQPGSPAAGDRYILPPAVSGANWTGNGNTVAEFDGFVWSFLPLQTLMLAFVTAEETDVLFLTDRWLEVVDKRRVDFYDMVDEGDQFIDEEQSVRAVQTYALSPTLGGEQFNFGLSQSIARATFRRMLKSFNLPYNEAVGLAEHFTSFYDSRNAQVEALLSIMSLVGFDDYAKLSVSTRRFLAENIHAIYPRAGSEEAVDHGFRVWAGEQLGVVFKNYADNMFVANESMCPVITPSPDPDIGDLTDDEDVAISLTWATLAHPRALGVWINRPFDPRTFLYQTPVKSATLTAPPVGPTLGDRYIVAANATGAWLGQDLTIAQWNGIAWDFIAPQDRWTVLVEATERIAVWRSSPTGAWWEPVDADTLLRVEWWLRNYALPGTVYFQFMEYEVAAPVTPPVDTVLLFEGFELWP